MKKKIIKISLFAIFITILTVFGIFNLINNISTAANSETGTQSSAKPGTLMAGEKDPNAYSYKTNFGTWIYESYTNQGTEGWYIPRKDGYQIYCVEPDTHIGYGWDITYNQYSTQIAETPNPAEGDCYRNHYEWYLEKNPPTTAHGGYLGKEFTAAYGTTLFFDAENYHSPGINYTPVKWTAKYTKDLSPALAYIVSHEPLNTWTKEKQQAVWNLAGSSEAGDLTIKPSNNVNKQEQASLGQEAKDYADYDGIVRPNDGLLPDDTTNVNNVTTKVDQNIKEYMVGPFTLSYTNGIYDTVAFSGISEMKLAGYNINGEKIKTITIKQFVINGKKVDPNYFVPDQTLKTDKASNQKYPMPDEEFEVIFDDPNEGIEVTDKENRVVKVGLKVEFKYMLANGEYTYYTGEKHQLIFIHTPMTKNHTHLTCTKTTHTHSSACQGEVTDEEGNVIDTKTCTKTEHQHTDSCYEKCGPYKCQYINIDYEEQPLIAADAIRSIYVQELNPDDNPHIDITMDIEGKVWEDEKSGKETLADGQRADSEKPVDNIPVILYDDENNIVEETKTDANGEYKFEKLDAMRKYYVEFKYNGQQYENTIYEDKLDDKHSVATETTSDRNSLNEKFKEIDGDEGYTIEQLRYDDQRSQYYNAPDMFTLSAFTGSDGKDELIKYPKYEQFVIKETGETINGVTYKAIYDEEDSIKNIDFGITQRIEFDMALKTDLYIATVKINGKTEVYGYDKKLENVENGQKANSDTGYAQWEITVVGGYDRSLDNADWNFKGENGNKNALLEVYATYKIAVRNQSMSMLGHVTKLYDYYDDTFEYVDSLSWQSKTNYKNNKDTRDKLQNSIEKGNVSDWGTKPKASDDKKGTLTIDVDKKQETGETQYIYLTFKLKNDSNGQVSLGDKINKAEIGSFITYYKGGKTTLPHYNGQNSYSVTGDDMIAGRVDRDSIPNSMKKDGKPGKNELYDEDDEDDAPNLNVKLTGDIRKLNGTAWEDERTVNSGGAIIGNGIMDKEELKIAGIQVDLVEKTVWDENNPKGEYLWETAYTDENGTYEFNGYIPGDYIIRFKYGEGLSGVDKNNGISYNGQDYKTTTYQAEIAQTPTTDLDSKYKGYLDVENQNETGTYGFNIATKKDNVSDAKDIWSIREQINNYSNNNVTNGIAEILAIPYETPKYNEDSNLKEETKVLRQELIKHTTATAETGVVVVEVERNLQSESENGDPSYKIENINIGLVERPKAQLEIDKSISNIKVTLANNSVLFDVNGKSDNVIWKDHTAYNLASKKENGKYKEYYGKSDRYNYRGTVDSIVKKADKGLVQLTMDEELMHGATIEITYKIVIENDGEVDYEGQKFYYTGNSSGGKVVTTTANQIVDYVANNLQFNSEDDRNTGWSVISKSDLVNQNLVNSKLSSDIKNFNTIIQTKDLSEKLGPGDAVEKTLVLTELITPENTSDDLTYRNIAEIVKTSNTVGRRMAYSIVGNQNPTLDAQEVDASVAEKVIILPPFGSSPIYYILGITIAVILIGGITLIIKKVLIK